MSFNYITNHKELKYKVGDTVFIDLPYMDEVPKNYSDIDYLVIGIKSYKEGLRYSIKAECENFYLHGVEEHKLVTMDELWNNKIKWLGK